MLTVGTKTAAPPRPARGNGAWTRPGGSRTHATREDAVKHGGLGLHLARMGMLWHKELGGQEIGFDPPVGPIAIGWAVVAAMTRAAAMPAVRALMRRSVRELVA